MGVGLLGQRNKKSDDTDCAPSLAFGLGYLKRLRRDALGFFEEMKADHPDQVRIPLGNYRFWLLFHPKQIIEVLEDQSEAFERFDWVMKVMSQWAPASSMLTEGQTWKDRRRQVLPAFARHRFDGYGARFVRLAEDMATSWEARLQNGTVRLDTKAELADLSMRVALDTLLGDGEAEASMPLRDAIGNASKMIHSEILSPWYIPDWVPLPKGRGKRNAMHTVRQEVEAIIARRAEEGLIGRTDLLSALMASDEGDLEALRDEVTVLMVAGNETPGAAMTWCMEMLGQHPEIAERLQEEIGLVLGGRTPEFSDLDQMPLLMAVVEEVLRLHPPAYSFFTRRALCDVDLAGVKIAKGDLVQLTPYLTQRDERWFKNPLKFDPDRFLRGDLIIPGAFFAFGSGARACAGQMFARAEIALVTAVLLQRFCPVSVNGPCEREAKFLLWPKGKMEQRWVVAERPKYGRLRA